MAASSSDINLAFLANHALNTIKNNDNKRYMIGIIGIPCSGKSVLSHKLSNYINSIANEEICEYIGMDGFHYTRKYLDNMENPQLAHQKRGAHWTFDAKSFGHLLHEIATNNDKDIIAPTFDHHIKDPSPNGKIIKQTHKIIIIEGLYLFLNIEPWNTSVLPYFDEKWLLNCDFKLAEKRIIKRHVKSGIAKTDKDALFRWIDNDKPNGQFLLNNLDFKSMNVIMNAIDNGIQITNINWSIDQLKNKNKTSKL